MLTGEPVKISFYTHGPFTDLCRGPHVERTGQINPDAIKLLTMAGAYWRGSEKNPMLQRIYGTAFESAQELKEYLAWREEVDKRDHRKLGKQLDLFSTNPEVGGGLVLWHPKGGMIRHLAEEFCIERAHRGRLRPGVLAAHRARATVGDQRPPDVVQGRHVLADGH